MKIDVHTAFACKMRGGCAGFSVNSAHICEEDEKSELILPTVVLTETRLTDDDDRFGRIINGKVASFSR